jgi:predicted nucleic acid-binding protein
MYILDTNAVYYLINSAWTSPEQLARLQQKAHDGLLKIGLPPVTVMELATRIVEEPSWFDQIKSATLALIDLCPTTLPDPEQRMREIVEDINLARQSYEHWYQIIATIARAPDLESLQRGFDDYATATHRSANVIHVATYREDYERQYVRDMVKVVREFNPNYDDQILKNKTTKLPQSEQNALRTFFASTEWTDTFVALLASRGGSGVIPTDPGKLAVILAKAKYFKLGYETLGLSMFCDGARPNLKRKNDYNDIHQLLYVNEYTTDVLVSEDGGVIEKSASSSGKSITFKQFLSSEAA